MKEGNIKQSGFRTFSNEEVIAVDGGFDEGSLDDGPPIVELLYEGGFSEFAANAIAEVYFDNVRAFGQFYYEGQGNIY